MLGLQCSTIDFVSELVTTADLGVFDETCIVVFKNQILVVYFYHSNYVQPRVRYVSNFLKYNCLRTTIRK